MTVAQGTFAEWLIESLEPEWIHDLAYSGAVNGVPGLIYYRDTTALYERFHDEIWDALSEDADSMGWDSSMDLIGNMSGGKDIRSQDQLANLLVWFMAEREALRLIESGQVSVEED